MTDDGSGGTGRRRGRPRRPAGGVSPGKDTRAQILDAARDEFSRHGYAAATIRAIAAAAGVDPSLVHHFYGTKRALFASSLRLPDVFDHFTVELLDEDDPEQLGVRLVRLYLGLWENPDTAPQVRMMVAAAVSDERAAQALKEFLATEILAPVVAASARDHVALRVTLAASHLVGLAMARHVLALDPLAAASIDDLAAWVGPTVTRYLTDPEPSALG